MGQPMDFQGVFAMLRRPMDWLGRRSILPTAINTANQQGAGYTVGYTLMVNDAGDAAWTALPLTKAGIPSDADYAVAPRIGTMVLDTTNNRIYFRTAAATWKYAALT